MKNLILATMLVFTVLLLPTISSATPTTVPHFLNYQSLLYDDGGNLLADGPANITFKLTDALGNVLYEERQTLDVVHGAVSALVGNGLDGSGAPMGGIPASVLTPDGARYLEVTVDGYPPESGLEIVAVPYSVYAEKALAVADEGVTGAMLAKKSITMDHLADGLIDQIANQMTSGGTIATRTDLTNLQTTYRSIAGAGSIGVNGGFVYSGSTNIQGVLQDLDRSVQKREAEISAHANATSGVHGVTGNVVGTQNVQTLTNKTLMMPTITGGMTLIGGNVNMNGNTITGLPAPSGPNDAATLSYVDNAVSAETTARQNADAAEATARQAADAEEATARQTADAAEASTRYGYDTNHEERLQQLEGKDNNSPITAWGTLAPGPIFNGYNATLSYLGGLSFRISFIDQLKNINYALTVTASSGSPTVSNKSTDGFTVTLSEAGTFDFIVVGPLL
jgi:hypothetical protein